MFERSTIHDILGDLVVYRNLEPCDTRVPGLSKLRARLGLESGRIPRKAEPEYATVVVQILCAAQVLRLPGRPLARLLYLGDTVMNDRGAINNLRAHFPTLGFIGCDEAGAPRRVQTDEGVMTANRWEALMDFVRWVKNQGFALDEETAAVIDLDKTAFGARGRNDGTIDAARVEAVRRTAEEVLGGAFDEATFLPIYNELKRPAYHPFTADNQDYLTFICLMASASVYPFDQLLDDLAAGRLASFAQFIEICNHRIGQAEGHGSRSTGRCIAISAGVIRRPSKASAIASTRRRWRGWTCCRMRPSWRICSSAKLSSLLRCWTWPVCSRNGGCSSLA